MLFLPPNQQCQSTEGKDTIIITALVNGNQLVLQLIISVKFTPSKMSHVAFSTYCYQMIV